MKGIVMRITIVLGPFKPPPPAPSGAVEKAWWSLARSFVAAGHAVTVVGPDHPDLPRGDGWDGIAYRRLPLLGRSGRTWIDVIRDFGWSRRAKSILPESEVTVTNCVWLPWLLGRGGSPARRRLGVLEVHVQRFPKGQMRLYRSVDSISTVSPAIADAIAREQTTLAGRVRVVPNPVDLAVFHTTEQSEARRDLSSPAILLYTGRIHPEKRL
ncbi:MAG: glycosyltransferase, partial [Phycisphaerales bacterium]